MIVHGGTYFLDAPFVLTPEDSGAAEAPVVYEAAAGEKPLLSGGRRFAGWKDVTVDAKPLWSVDLPDVREGKWYFRQLWVNGRRAVRARGPNHGFHEVAGLPDGPPEPGQDRFTFHGDDLRAWNNWRMWRWSPCTSGSASAWRWIPSMRKGMSSRSPPGAAAG